MVAQATRPKFTYADYLIAPDDARYELLDGELIMVPVPNVWHQSASIYLSHNMVSLILSVGIGYVFAAPIDVYFTDTDVVQPDLVFISNARARA